MPNLLTQRRQLSGRPLRPDAVQGLAIWLDGADSSTFTIGTGVSLWGDKSGFGRSPSQATGSSQPVVSTETLTGLTALKFEQKSLSHSGTYALGSFFIVWEHPTTFSGSYNGICGYRTYTTGSDFDMSTLLPFTPGGPPPNRITQFYNAADTSTVIRLNGVQRSSAENEFTTGSPARVSPNRWNYMSATFPVKTGVKALYLGTEAAAPATRLMQNGHIAEVIGYSRTLPIFEVAGIERYLSNKWGVIL